MDILQLETFLEIVNTKSINKAAQKLFISQPTASHRLTSLEEELGVPLIERNKGIRNIRLTTFGEKFIPIAYKWYDLWNDLQIQMREQYKLPLSLGCSESMNIHIFAPFYKGLLRGQYGGHSFDLHIRTERSTEIHKLIEKRDLDVGFVYSLHPNSNILITPLFAEKMYVLRLKDRVEENRTAYHPSELESRYEIYTNWSDEFQMWHQNFWSLFSPFAQLDSEYLIHDFLDAPELWAIAPESVAVSFSQRDPAIGMYELLENPPKRIYYKITHRLPREIRAAAIQIFCRELDQFLLSQGLTTPIAPKVSSNTFLK